MPRLDNDGSLQYGGGRNKPTRVLLNQLIESSPLRLVEKYRKQGRCINNH